MMAQYLEIKTANPDCLLFYRMGDFYELFFDDAAEASRALGIELTKRGKHLGADIPMCGVPVHRADDYLQKLIRAGFRVAVCEQTEDPAEAKKRGAKAVVRREVVRLVTPGTITEETLLDARANNFLTALFRAPTATSRPAESFALASLDISTGEFLVSLVEGGDLTGELARIAPSEVIAGEDLTGEPRITAAIEQAGAALTPVPRTSFDSLAGERSLKERLGLATLEGLAPFSRPELAAVGALLTYVSLTQIGRAPALRPPRRDGARATLVIDAATRANLELVRAQAGTRRGSLLAAMDRTVSGAGARELASRIASPLTDADAINARLDAVGWLLAEPVLRREMRARLKACPDAARALARLTLGRGGPRDLAALRDALGAARACADALAGADSALTTELEGIAARLAAVDPAVEQALAAALDDELPLLARDGGFVRPGHRADLDEARSLRDDARKVIASLQAAYAAATGIKSLKVRHNNVLGYFVEVTAANGDALMRPPLNETFIHRQTLASAVRFTTMELAETQSKIIAARERAVAIELEVFASLLKQVAQSEAGIGDVAAALAATDHYCGLAELAEEQSHVRPQIDASTAFLIEDGRHPVVEQALAVHGEVFVRNDCRLGGSDGSSEGDGETPSDSRIWLVTGPNMAGKSTFLRQNALIVVMAQAGAYVPARSAHIGVVDRVFSRVGASDDLAGGRSTFMVEMVETAGILNQAGPRSFVILDEVGRGTATFDGLSIAWATVEHLHEVNRCRALFATHYHELTALANTLARAANVTMEVKDWNEEVVFLHKVVAGAADRSYGIHVARLAGLPGPVVARAQEVLRRLEGGERALSASDLVDDLPLFSAARPVSGSPEPALPSAVEEALAGANPDEMTPKQALDLLYSLKEALLTDERRG